MVSFFQRVATVQSFRQHLWRTAEFVPLLADLLAWEGEKQGDDNEPVDRAPADIELTSSNTRNGTTSPELTHPTDRDKSLAKSEGEALAAKFRGIAARMQSDTTEAASYAEVFRLNDFSHTRNPYDSDGDSEIFPERQEVELESPRISPNATPDTTPPSSPADKSCHFSERWSTSPPHPTDELHDDGIYTDATFCNHSASGVPPPPPPSRHPGPEQAPAPDTILQPIFAGIPLTAAKLDAVIAERERLKWEFAPLERRHKAAEEARSEKTWCKRWWRIALEHDGQSGDTMARLWRPRPVSKVYGGQGGWFAFPVPDVVDRHGVRDTMRCDSPLKYAWTPEEIRAEPAIQIKKRKPRW